MSWITSRSKYPRPLVRSEQVWKQSDHSFLLATWGVGEETFLIRQQMWMLDLIGFGPIYLPGSHILVCNIRRLDKIRMVSNWHVFPILQNFTFYRYFFLTHQSFFLLSPDLLAIRGSTQEKRYLSSQITCKGFVDCLKEPW